MKKKCTDSGCRKVFTYDKNALVVCPFCGKEYPRLGNYSAKFYVVIDGKRCDFSALKRKEEFVGRKAKAAMVIRRATGLNLRTIKKIVDILFSTGELVTKAVTKEQGDLVVIETTKIWG